MCFRAPEADQRILMKAASNVVLRRDLSLNRRLFAWLLGSGPEEGHAEFFRANVLDLLRDTLREDMFASPHPDSRPFKIFISLLDKWELGGPLVDVLFYDALKAIKRSVLLAEETAADVSACRLLVTVPKLNVYIVLQLLMTGNALYEAVEPLAVWSQLFKAVRLELIASTSSTLFEAMSMVKFVLIHLRAQEEEVQEVHLPIFFTALLEHLKVPIFLHSLIISGIVVISQLMRLSGARNPRPSKIKCTIYAGGVTTSWRIDTADIRTRVDSTSNPW